LPALIHDLQIHRTAISLGDYEVAVHVSILSIHSSIWQSRFNFVGHDFRHNCSDFGRTGWHERTCLKRNDRRNKKVAPGRASSGELSANRKRSRNGLRGNRSHISSKPTWGSRRRESYLANNFRVATSTGSNFPSPRAHHGSTCGPAASTCPAPWLAALQ
jgi:hypothetical protein